MERLKREWNVDKELVNAAGESALGQYEIGSYDKNRGLGSKMKKIENETGNVTDIIALDDFLTEPYSFLKADIEGVEYHMLLGAKNGISKYKPKLAVCIYHNSVDFYSILLLIHAMVPEYQFAVRHHSNSWDETVLYAWCE